MSNPDVRIYFSALMFNYAGRQFSVPITSLVADGLLHREIRQVADALVVLAPRSPSARTWTQALDQAMGARQDPTGPAARLAWQIWTALGGSPAPAGDTRLPSPAPVRAPMRRKPWLADRG